MMLDRKSPQPAQGLFLGHEQGRLRIHQECNVDTNYVEVFVKGPRNRECKEIGVSGYEQDLAGPPGSRTA